VKLFVDGREVEFKTIDVQIDRLSDRLVVKTSEGAATAVAVRSGDAVLISYRGQQYKVERSKPRGSAQGTTGSGELLAPMPGQIVDVLVTVGSIVQRGDRILILEAMKTQQSFTAPFDGTVIKLGVAKGDQVVDGAMLAVIKPSAGV
jgi:3-methylcrotonyl-CoA carboxylase alpha subunit